MADITMCGGVDAKGLACEKKFKCYRYMATPGTFRQSWFMDAPVVVYEGKQACAHEWPMEPEGTQ